MYGLLKICNFKQTPSNTNRNISKSLPNSPRKRFRAESSCDSLFYLDQKTSSQILYLEF